MVVQQTFLSQALPQRMRTNTGFPSTTGNAMIVGSNSGGNLFQPNRQQQNQNFSYSNNSNNNSVSNASHLKSHNHHLNGSHQHHQLSSHMMSHLINPEAHGFATPPPSVLPSAQNTPTDGHNNGQTQFLTPTSTTSLFGCQQVPELNHTRAVHSPAITPPEHPSLDAKLLAAVSAGTTPTSQAAVLNAFHQTLAAAAASGQINGNNQNAVSALALSQLFGTPAGAAAMAQNPMLLAAMTALNNGANWQHPSVLPALFTILQQNYDQQGFAAMQAALMQEAQLSQHRQLLAQLQQQHQVHMAAAAAAAAMNQDQISMEKAAAAAAMHNNGDPRLISHPQWMSPPLSSNTPTSSSSPLIFSERDEMSNTGATAGTSTVPSSGSSGHEENSSPCLYRPDRQPSSFDSLVDYNRWDCDDVERILTEQSGLSEKESIAVAVLAGLATIR